MGERASGGGGLIRLDLTHVTIPPSFTSIPPRLSVWLPSTGYSDHTHLTQLHRRPITLVARPDPNQPSSPRTMVTDSWQTIAASKRARNAALIPTEWLLPSPPSSEVRNVIDVPRTCGILTEKEVEITEKYSASGLVGEMAKGTYSAVEVTTAFCKRAAIAQQLVSAARRPVSWLQEYSVVSCRAKSQTNCLTEVFFDKATERAKELDEHYAKTGKTVGPLQ